VIHNLLNQKYSDMPKSTVFFTNKVPLFELRQVYSLYVL